MDKNDQDLIYSTRALRKAIGWLGISLPFTLMTGYFLFFHGNRILDSISHYYFTGMHDIFVATISGIALLLFFYKGYDNWKRINGDTWVTNLGGLSAIGIAFFPANVNGATNWTGSVHFLCSALFFLLFALYFIFVFTRKAPGPTKEKLVRNKIYLICGWVIIACLLAILLYFSFFLKQNSTSSFVFWTEAVAISAFGISWLTKGGAISPDRTIADPGKNE